VAAAQHGGDNAADDVGLADDDRADLVTAG